MVWGLKGQDGNSHGDGKVNVWQKNVGWAIFSGPHREDLEQMGLARFFSSYHTQFLLNYSYL